MLAFGLDAYNASIVAEGVETQSELTTLQPLGCHYGQGHYLGRSAQMSVLPRQLSQPRCPPESRPAPKHSFWMSIGCVAVAIFDTDSAHWNVGTSPSLGCREDSVSG